MGNRDDNTINGPEPVLICARDSIFRG